MKRILWITLIQMGFALIVQKSAFSQERRSFYTGARCQAMGGACIAVVNDETSLFVNPAGLGRLRDFYGTVFDPELEANSAFPDFYNLGTGLSNPFSLEDIMTALGNRKATPYHAKLQLSPSFVARNFGFGLLYNNILDAEMSADGSTVNAYYRNDLAFALGFNFRFFSGRVKLGFNAKLINRIEAKQQTLSSTASKSYENIASEGLGLSTDAGIILSAPWQLIPTLSVVARNIGGTNFDQASGLRLTTASRPDALKQDVDVAVAMFPIYGPGYRSSWTVEYRSLLTAQDETDKAKLIHGGVEFNFNDIFFLRAGYNQRYWTAGLELSSENTQWQFTSYGEEIGTATSNKEDRRYILKYAFRF